MIARALLIVATLVATLPFAARAQTYGLQFVSQAGDSIGRGQTYSISFAASAAIVQSYGVGSAIDLVIRDGDTSWSLQIESANGQPIVEGSYQFAERGYSAAPGHPSLSFSGDGRGCNQAYGQFQVRELVRGANNSVERIAVHFIQHCEGFEPVLSGSIHVNSTLPMPPQAPLPDYPSAFLQLMSMPGDYVGGGSNGNVRVDRTRTRPDLFQVTENGAGGVQVNIGPPSPQLGEMWSLQFEPPPGQQLTVGTYENALWPSSPGRPGINVGGDGRGCSATGRFVVLEIENGPLHTFSKLAIDFEQHCGGMPPGLYGGLRYNSSVPYVPPTPAPVATRLAYVDGVSGHLAAPGATLTNIRFATVDDTGFRVGNQPVTIGGCGSFGGVSYVEFVSDASGVATVPPWTAPMELGMCGLQARLRGIAAMPLELTMTISPATNPPPPPPPPPSTPPVTTATGAGVDGSTVTLSLTGGATTCKLAGATFTDPRVALLPAGAPAMLSMPQVLIDFRTEECGAGQPVTFTVQFAQPLPLTAQWFKYGPTSDNRAPHWYTIPAVVDGNRITFTITDGAIGDDDLMANGSISDLGMVSTPGGMTQDLWWSGLAENGWGMSIIQHRDVLFANMFVYDAQGKPVWYVMPSGSWNAARTSYTGALYLPKGSPFFAYDVSKFQVGASVGSATLTFTNPNEGTFDYAINGTTGRKSISRIPFGPRDAPTDTPYADLWWGGTAQNGWGVALLQQYSSLFALWFTYDASGNPTWFVMPAGNWTSRNVWSGKTYRAEGSAWLGVPYDASRHRTVENGSFRLDFNGGTAKFDYTVEGRSGSVPLSRIPF